MDMQVNTSSTVQGFASINIIKSFLIWSFTLLVCLLVVGFPLLVVMLTVGALATIVLHSILPVSSVLVVASSIIGINLGGIFLSAAFLALKGIHPQDVSWLNWLHGQSQNLSSSVYASCPLTCELSLS